MKRSVFCVATIFVLASCCVAGAEAVNSDDKKDRLEITARLGCGKAIELQVPESDETAYLKNCFPRVAAHAEAVRKTSAIRFLVWDVDHDTISGYATAEEAKQAKGENDTAELVSPDDQSFRPLLDALRWRIEKSLGDLKAEGVE